jgi:hypothetical protein
MREKVAPRVRPGLRAAWRELAARQEPRSPTDSLRGSVILELAPGARDPRQPGWPQWSDDERELRSGGLRRRLNELALTGRISKEEYDAFFQRLNKTGF